VDHPYLTRDDPENQSNARLASNVLRKLCVILHVSHAFLAGTVGAAVKGPIGFNAMTYDLTVTVITNGRQLVYRTLKAIKRMARTRRYNLE